VSAPVPEGLQRPPRYAGQPDTTRAFCDTTRMASNGSPPQQARAHVSTGTGAAVVWQSACALHIPSAERRERASPTGMPTHQTPSVQWAATGTTTAVRARGERPTGRTPRVRQDNAHGHRVTVRGSIPHPYRQVPGSLTSAAPAGTDNRVSTDRTPKKGRSEAASRDQAETSKAHCSVHKEHTTQSRHRGQRQGVRDSRSPKGATNRSPWNPSAKREAPHPRGTGSHRPPGPRP
jgi:hypothetical protein